jgi:hypothetical protein
VTNSNRVIILHYSTTMRTTHHESGELTGPTRKRSRNFIDEKSNQQLSDADKRPKTEEEVKKQGKKEGKEEMKEQKEEEEEKKKSNRKKLADDEQLFTRVQGLRTLVNREALGGERANELVLRINQMAESISRWRVDAYNTVAVLVHTALDQRKEPDVAQVTLERAYVVSVGKSKKEKKETKRQKENREKK